MRHVWLMRLVWKIRPVRLVRMVRCLPLGGFLRGILRGRVWFGMVRFFRVVGRMRRRSAERRKPVRPLVGRMRMRVIPARMVAMMVLMTMVWEGKGKPMPVIRSAETTRANEIIVRLAGGPSQGIKNSYQPAPKGPALTLRRVRLADEGLEIGHPVVNLLALPAKISNLSPGNVHFVLILIFTVTAKQLPVGWLVYFFVPVNYPSFRGGAVETEDRCWCGLAEMDRKVNTINRISVHRFDSKRNRLL